VRRSLRFFITMLGFLAIHSASAATRQNKIESNLKDVTGLKLKDKLVGSDMVHPGIDAEGHDMVVERFCRSGMWIKIGGPVAGSANYEIHNDEFCIIYATGKKACRRLRVSHSGDAFAITTFSDGRYLRSKVIMAKTKNNQSC
jgi:hypothetical protein